MSNKIKREKEPYSNAGVEIIGQIMEYMLAMIVMAVCIVVPFYARDGYHQIGEAKFTAYKSVLMIGFVMLFVMTVVYLIFWLKDKKEWNVSVTDMMVVGYLILSGISIVSGGFYEDALWGCSGWNMGFLSQLSFVLLYLFLSRYGRYYRLIIAVLCSVAAVVFLIGVLHRMLIDPIGFYDGLADYQKAQFLSTLGQATWYGSFLVVVLPLGIAVFLYTENRMWRVISGMYVFLGFCTLVTQNSDSAYFALAGFMLVFFGVSVEKRDSLYRFVLICMLFLAAGKLMYFLLQINPNPALEYDVITKWILCSAGTWVLLALCLFGCVILFVRKSFFQGDQSAYPVEKMLRVRRGVFLAVGILLAGVILMIVLQAKNLLPGALAERLQTISYFNWNDSWGNGRGRIWSFSVRMCGEESLLHKLFGVGPDCFNSYVTAYYSEDAQLLWGEKLLTNAHNEWLNMLINAGLLGAVAYIGIFVTAIFRFLKKRSGNLLVTGVAACAVSYMAYNFFCYQQVLCTPFIFILLGIGEYILRNEEGCCRDGKSKGVIFSHGEYGR